MGKLEKWLGKGFVLVESVFSLLGALTAEPVFAGFDADGEMIRERTNLGATLMPDGKILFVGGGNQGTMGAEIFDPRLAASRELPAMRGANSYSSSFSAVLKDGRIVTYDGFAARVYQNLDDECS